MWFGFFLGKRSNIMYSIKTVNKISKEGLDQFDSEGFNVSDAVSNPDALLLRSQNIKDMDFPSSLKAIGRAGAGVNNIPVDRCTDQNIVVFNTPGANANAVKELVLLGLLLSARDIVGGIRYARSLEGEDSVINELIEANKSNFKGVEIRGKKLGVLGLGAIGMMVANDATSLGLKVQGHDPFISVKHAWKLSRAVKPAENIKKMFSESDFISLHVPLTEETKKFVNKNLISQMKKGAVLLNFARNGLIDQDDLIEALDSGHLKKFVTDFPSKALLKHKDVICIPHLGASTREAETNCAVMVANQIIDYLEDGNINNSVNFPNCSIERSGEIRIAISNENVPNVIGQVTAILADAKLNIVDMVNKSKGSLAYTIIDLNGDYSAGVSDKIREIKGIKALRVLKNVEKVLS
jgi:D-3-phosphoglycerate dehydrogenase / 2-oxoglutarate reductase